MSYKNIIVAIDGSEPSRKAFERGVAVAKQHGARLILAHIIDDRRKGRVEIYSPSFFKKLEEKMRRILSEHKKEAEDAGVETVEVHVGFGSPKVEIPKRVAPKFEADLIICGSTGMSGVERWVLGSVSEGIARQSECDVFIVK